MKGKATVVAGKMSGIHWTFPFSRSPYCNQPRLLTNDV